MFDHYFQEQMGDRTSRILAITHRMLEIQEAINLIRYDQELAVEAPDALRVLGEAKKAAIAELKTV